MLFGDFAGKYTREEMANEVRNMFVGVLDDDYPDNFDDAVERITACFPEMSDDEAYDFANKALIEG